MLKTQNKRLSLVVLLVAFVVLLSSVLTVIPAGAATISEIEQEKHVLFAAEDGYYETATSTLTKVGPVNKGGATSPVLANTVTLTDFSSSGVVSSTGGLAFRFHSGYAAYVAGAISFTTPVELKYVTSVTFRMKARLSSDGEFCEPLIHGGNYGVRFYGLNDTGVDFSGHKLTKTITQGEWIDYTISGASLSSIATDDNGVSKLMGLQVGVSLEKQEDDSYFYTGKTSEGNAYIVIDYITCDINESLMNKESVIEKGTLLASADNSANLVSANITNVNSISNHTVEKPQRTAYDIYTKEDSASANSSVWAASFHSSLATRVTSAIQFTNPVELSSIDNITIRLNAHFSPTEGMYFTDMGGVMLCKLSETDCRKTNYSHSISRSVAQDEWIDYKISGAELAKLVEDDGTIKGIQIASDMRGSTSTSFYIGTPSQKQSWLLIDYIYYTPKFNVEFEDENGKIDGIAGSTSNGKFELPEYDAPANKLFIGWKLTVDSVDYLYKTGEEITLSQDAVLTAVSIDFTMNMGASIRVGDTAEQSGLRFSARYSNADYDAISEFILERGMLILPTDTLGDKEFILDNFNPDPSAKQILVIKGTNVTDLGDDTMFTGVIQNVKVANYARAFSARAYLKIDYTSGAEYVYADYNEMAHSRSVKYVAKAVIADTEVYNSFSPEKQAVLNAYAAAE